MDYINLISENSDILGNLASKAGDIVSNFGSNGGTPVQAIMENPLVGETVGTISAIDSLKYIGTIFLIIWGLSLLTVKFMPSIPQNVKDDVEYTNKVVFGNLGIVPMILILWILIITVTTVLPAILNITPKFSSFLGNANNTLSAVISTLISGTKSAASEAIGSLLK